MQKVEVELIIIKVASDGQDAINMKIYKNGTTCRYGVGGLPQLGIAGMSFFDNSVFFDALIAKVPDEIFENPILYDEETPNGSLEYSIMFYGVSSNGETGERAKWTKSNGVVVKQDTQSTFKHPLMGFLDSLTMEAIELTNEWYFDIIINSKWKVLSSTLPKSTIVTEPKTEKEINNDYENYVNQMMTSARQWSMADFGNNKTYDKAEKTLKATIKQSSSKFSIYFSKVDDPNSAVKRKWWQFW